MSQPQQDLEGSIDLLLTSFEHGYNATLRMGIKLEIMRLVQAEVTRAEKRVRNTDLPTVMLSSKKTAYTDVWNRIKNGATLEDIVNYCERSREELERLVVLQQTKGEA